MTNETCCGSSAEYVREQLKAAMDMHDDETVFGVHGFRVDVRYMELVPCCPHLVEWRGQMWRLNGVRQTTSGPWFLIAEYERWM